MKIIDTLLAIQADKAQHVLWGQISAFIGMLAQGLLATRFPEILAVDRRVTAVAVAALVGALKEHVYDRLTGGDVSNADIAATIVGGVSVAGAMTAGQP